MKTANTHQRALMRSRSLILIAVFMILGTIVAVPFYSALSSSLPTRPEQSARSSVDARQAGSLAKRNRVGWSPTLNSLVAPQPFVEGIATFASNGADCTTPKSDFFLGDWVCAKASGVQASPLPWRVLWVDTVGLIRQSNAASTDDTTTYLYQIPSTATSDVDGRTVDNRGNWSVKLTRSNGSLRQSAGFVVHELANPVSDVYVQKFVHSPSASVASGDNISFTLVVGNLGPDPAAVVHLIDSVLTGGTLVQFTQNSGPACVPTESGGPENDCAMATLINGERAEFTVIYNTGAAAPGDYSTSATVSTPNDPNSNNNTFSAPYTVTAGGGGGGGTCQIICPDNMNAIANTEEGGQRGAHVSFPAPVVSNEATCGTVTSTPASGSFFPVGTTTVNSSSELNDGSCSFTITVEDQGTNPPTITCPANPPAANANGDCEAVVAITNPTVTGNNVTFSGVRSDGKPMYNCDCFPLSPNQTDDACNIHGACTRRADAPFQSGTTTITWIAYSHSVPGPYATPEIEEAARTGGASCTVTVVVYDTTPPVITAQSSTVSAGANCQAPVPDYSNEVSDNCSCSSSDDSEDCRGRQRITLTQTPAAGTMVGLGPHTIHLEANDHASNPGPDGIPDNADDGTGNVTTKDITLTVVDTTPPTFTFVPGNITVNTGPGNTTCSAVVNPGQATAVDNCGSVTVTRSPSGNTFPVGTTTVTWTATDGNGNHTSATQTITVVDNTAPVITVNGYAPSMWPPNHKYETFTVTNFVTSVSDNCGGVGVGNVLISTVTSDETENGNGDGNTANDIVIAADCKSVQLRSERDGGGNGRVYTITFRLRDTHNNTTTVTRKVVVAHNPGETPIDSGVHYTVNGNCP